MNKNRQDIVEQTNSDRTAICGAARAFPTSNNLYQSCLMFFSMPTALNTNN
jgi:hypothetical protein